MKSYKKIVPMLEYQEGQLFFADQRQATKHSDCLDLCHRYDDQGADALLIRDLSQTDIDHENCIYMLKAIAREIDIPLIVGGQVAHLEDVKKYLYAGAQAVFLDVSVEDNIDIMKEVSDRFGSEKIYAYLPDSTYLHRVEEFAQLGASLILLDEIAWQPELNHQLAKASLPFFVRSKCDQETASRLFECQNIAGMLVAFEANSDISCQQFKQQLQATGILVELMNSSLSWSHFKLNSDGMIPVIVQDYRTQQVLMLAYMNETAFSQTIATGMMTYFSRSRGRLWTKGETSGHFQYVKSLDLDCDQDTLLAKVRQLGPACHTGKQSCFFNHLVHKEYQEANPLKVFEEVYDTIMQRKETPKEGSYTNYLFDKGLDKILKKLGEEATEIVIAAKNPNTEEIKYEISDFLYHMMVLMAEKRITWEEITKELSNRA